MSRTSTPSAARKDRDVGSRAPWIALAVLAALLLGLALLLAYPMAYGDQALPGVRVAGVEVGGMSEAEAAARLRAELPGLAEQIELRDLEDDRGVPASPAALGLPWDAGALAAAAMEAGRGPWPGRALLTRWRGIDVATDLRLDEARAAAGLEALAPEFDIAPRDAAVSLVEGELVETAALPGEQLDIPASLERLRRAAPHPEQGIVYVTTRRTAPRVYSDEGVGDAYRLATEKPLELVWSTARRWTVEPEMLATWFSIAQRTNDQGDRQPYIVIDRGAVERWVAPIEEELRQDPRDARFRWGVEGVTVLAVEQPGLRLDVPATVDRLIEAAYWEGRVVEPVVGISRPAITRNAVAGLQGLREVGQAATSLAGLPAEHVTVLAAATSRLNGVVVPGTARFSFQAALGAIEDDPAFDPVRVAGEALPEEKGMLAGVDQLSTTAFRAALWAGMPVIERHAPSRRSGWLEPPVGLDAVVDPSGAGTRDLVLENDRPGPLLMAVELDAARGALMWTIYGHPPFREVRLLGPELSGPTPPAPATDRASTLLPPGMDRQIGWAREGASARYTRAVYEADGTLRFEDAIESAYAASGDTILRGPTR